jgi:alanine-glyoxylate transaminase / serine-glyoxylate transaminase / serine-pyruvate transaminase
VFCGTAPTHHLYGLREALDMIAEEGLEAIWAGTRGWPARSGRRSRPGGRGADALNIADPARAAMR